MIHPVIRKECRSYVQDEYGVVNWTLFNKKRIDLEVDQNALDWSFSVTLEKETWKKKDGVGAPSNKV